MGVDRRRAWKRLRRAGALYNSGAPYFVGTITGADSTLDAGGVPDAGANGVVVKMQDDGGPAWVHPHPNALGGSLSADQNDILYAGFSAFQDAGGGTDFAGEGLAHASGSSLFADYFGGPPGKHVIFASAAPPTGGAFFIGSTTGTGVLSSKGTVCNATKTDVVLVHTFGSPTPTVKGFSSLGAATPFAAAADTKTNLIVGGAFLNNFR